MSSLLTLALLSYARNADATVGFQHPVSLSVSSHHAKPFGRSGKTAYYTPSTGIGPDAIFASKPIPRIALSSLMETKERPTTDKTSEPVNGNSDTVNGHRTNGSVFKGNGSNKTENTDSTSSGDLIDFFDRIFQQQSFSNSTNGSTNGLNGDRALSDIQRSIESLTEGALKENVPDILDLTVDFANEVYRNITDNNTNGQNGKGGSSGTHDAFSINLDQLASSSTTFSDDLPTEITNSITELFRQLEVALDERFVEVCEEIAFYDAQGLRSNRDVVPGPVRLTEEDYERRRMEREQRRKERAEIRKTQLATTGSAEIVGKTQGASTMIVNATASSSAANDENEMTYMSDISRTSKRMRTKEIMRNFNVAPIYYTIALCMRWVQKASVPPMAMLMVLRSIAYPLKWAEGTQSASGGSRLFGKAKKSAVEVNGRTKTFGDEQIADEEFIQGWKRTGEIAAKGKRGRAIATFRRSAEIWFYFSSFYIKDTWILKNYNSGRWKEQRFKDERAKLGAQLTQNLLRLGPTCEYINIAAMNENLFYTSIFSYLYMLPPPNELLG